MMECCYAPLTGSQESELNWKIIRHPLYQPRTSPWLDLRVFYVRFSSFEVDMSTPEHLTLKHIPLSPDTIIEVNGKRSSIYSECVFSLLRRDRVDREAEEATFVGTDSIRMTGSLRFEVYSTDGLLLSGTLELCDTTGFTAESKNHCKKWSISCRQEMPVGTGVLKGKQRMRTEALSPTVDVYVTGCFSGTPIILTRTLKLVSGKKHRRKAMLDSIPEYEESIETKEDIPSKALQATDELGLYQSENNPDDGSDTFYSSLKYLEGEHGDLSWFNAGVRVGVGIGLGVFLGVGVGVGLLFRTYQGSTRRFRKRLI